MFLRPGVHDRQQKYESTTSTRWGFPRASGGGAAPLALPDLVGCEGSALVDLGSRRRSDCDSGVPLRCEGSYDITIFVGHVGALTKTVSWSVERTNSSCDLVVSSLPLSFALPAKFVS